MTCFSCTHQWTRAACANNWHEITMGGETRVLYADAPRAAVLRALESDQPVNLSDPAVSLAFTNIELFFQSRFGCVPFQPRG